MPSILSICPLKPSIWCSGVWKRTTGFPGFRVSKDKTRKRDSLSGIISVYTLRWKFSHLRSLSQEVLERVFYFTEMLANLDKNSIITVLKVVFMIWFEKSISVTCAIL